MPDRGPAAAFLDQQTDVEIVGEVSEPVELLVAVGETQAHANMVMPLSQRSRG